MTTTPSLGALAAASERSSMIRQVSAALAIAVVLAMPMHLRAQQRDKIPAGFSIVDGDKDPNAIPDYVAWRQAFRMLGPDRTVHPGMPNDELMLPYVAQSEREIICNVARRSAAAEAAMRAKMAKALADFQAAGLDVNKKEDAKTIGDALFAIDYEQRVTTLQERDGLMELLKPETHVHVLLWIQKVKAGMYTLLPTSELERYRLPS
jgi:hypothetical protein